MCRYHYCERCFDEIPGDAVNLGDDPTLSQRYNAICNYHVYELIVCLGISYKCGKLMSNGTDAAYTRKIGRMLHPFLSYLSPIPPQFFMQLNDSFLVHRPQSLCLYASHKFWYARHEFWSVINYPNYVFSNFIPVFCLWMFNYPPWKV